MATLEGSALVQHCISKALDSLRQRGYNVFLKCEQRQAIIQLFCNRDVIAILPTGFGKSMIYIVYVLARDEWLKTCGNECGCSVLIVSPLRSIIEDQIAFLLSLNYTTAKELANKSIADIIKSPP
jgi:superfamily II DNA helicase RecQ